MVIIAGAAVVDPIATPITPDPVRIAPDNIFEALMRSWFISVSDFEYFCPTVFIRMTKGSNIQQGQRDELRGYRLQLQGFFWNSYVYQPAETCDSLGGIVRLIYTR